jgi:hypothetical protein
MMMKCGTHATMQNVAPIGARRTKFLEASIDLQNGVQEDIGAVFYIARA